ncbi:Protein TPX2 [Dendrobium catenatum]|uniref:Protein TPX2 n=1 Tax=Dendrobium catenatum TaxID=906689 RepID=A0A2I0WTA7_9ASPA|nr:Protein TPX2 [Dendrobium catenatum]
MSPKLTLTRPKEPKLETAQRFRAIRIKSSDELEEEKLAKFPKFKACPFNKKIIGFFAKCNFSLHKFQLLVFQLHNVI